MRWSTEVLIAKKKQQITDEIGHLLNEMTALSHFTLPHPPFLPLLTFQPLSLAPRHLDLASVETSFSQSISLSSLSVINGSDYVCQDTH